MKALLISDIHSTIDSLNAVWEKESDSDIVIFAGDMIDYGFFPHEVVQWFKDHKCIAVRGNHDEKLLKKWQEGIKPEPDANGELSFWKYTMMNMTDDDFRFIESVPEEIQFELDGIHYYMAHRYDRANSVKMSLVEYRSHNFFEEIWAEKCPNIPAKKGIKRRIIYGHYHLCTLQLIDEDTMWMNPGSTSFRHGADTIIKGATYMVIKDGEVYTRFVDYPRERTIELIESTPLTEFEKRHGRSFYGNN